MKKSIRFLAACVAILCGVGQAMAQTVGSTNTVGTNATGTSAASIASGAVVVAPVTNSSPFTAGTLDQNVRTNAAASVGSTFVNGGDGGTCTGAGDALAVQVVGGGFNANKGGVVVQDCNTRLDAVNLVATGMSKTAVRMRQCQSPKQAEAFEDEADRMLQDANYEDKLEEKTKLLKYAAALRCPERLRPQWAKDRERAPQQAFAGQAPVAQRPNPWQAGG